MGRLINMQEINILITGPAGSGKTTVARHVCEALEKAGIASAMVGDDDGSASVDPMVQQARFSTLVKRGTRVVVQQAQSPIHRVNEESNQA